MGDFLSLLGDPTERSKLLANALTSVNRGAVAGTLGAPVDLANTLLNMGKAGVGYIGNKTGLLDASQMPMIDDSPVGGSDWIAEKMQQAGLISNYRNPTAEALAGGLLAPATGAAVQARAPQIARGLLQMQENAAAPSSMAQQGQRGMIRIDGRGQAPESRADVNRLSDRLQGLLEEAGAGFNQDKSRLSPARYFSVDTPQAETLKVRISDHHDVHGGNDFSVDPTAATTFEEMLSGLRARGVPVADRVKPMPKAVIDDATLGSIYGIPVDAMRSRGMDVDAIKARYKLTKQGYWTEK